MSVLSVADCRNSLEISRQFSPLVQLAGQFVGEGPGECGGLNIATFLYLNTLGSSQLLFWGIFSTFRGVAKFVAGASIEYVKFRL